MIIFQFDISLSAISYRCFCGMFPILAPRWIAPLRYNLNLDNRSSVTWQNKGGFHRFMGVTPKMMVYFMEYPINIYELWNGWFGVTPNGWMVYFLEHHPIHDIKRMICGHPYFKKPPSVEHDCCTLLSYFRRWSSTIENERCGTIHESYSMPEDSQVYPLVN